MNKDKTTLVVGLKLDEQDFEGLDKRIKELQRLEKSLDKLEGELGYRILTREQYATMCFENVGVAVREGKCTGIFRTISDEEWNNLSNGQSFVVVVNGEVCSIDYFNENILQLKN